MHHVWSYLHRAYRRVTLRMWLASLPIALGAMAAMLGLLYLLALAYLSGFHQDTHAAQQARARAATILDIPDEPEPEAVTPAAMTARQHTAYRVKRNPDIRRLIAPAISDAELQHTIATGQIPSYQPLPPPPQTFWQLVQQMRYGFVLIFLAMCLFCPVIICEFQSLRRQEQRLRQAA